MSSGHRIAGCEAIPEETTLVFRVEDESETEQEAILVRTNGSVACWLNYCQHLTDVKLDSGSGATMRNGELICENHGAYFEADTGLCTHGPCNGAYLAAVDVELADNAVFLVDDRYEFVGLGPRKTDEHDLTDTSHLEF